MLNKKQLFGSMLMFALLSPVCMNAMDDDSASQEQQRAASSSKKPAAPKSDAKAGADAAADADAGQNAGIMAMIDNKILYYANIPLQTALNKISAWGAKGKFVITLLAAYLGYSASGKVVDDVTSIPSTLKSIVGADCEEGECRGAKGWTEAA